MSKRFRPTIVAAVLLPLALTTYVSARTFASTPYLIPQECPRITISCPTEELTGGVHTYRVHAKVETVGQTDKLTYQWSVSSGVKIIEGQGTNSIKIHVSELYKTTTVRVKVCGLRANCDNTEMCSFSVNS